MASVHPKLAAAAVVGRRLPPILEIDHRAHATAPGLIRGCGGDRKLLLLAAVLRERLGAGRRVIVLDPKGDQPALVHTLRNLEGTPLTFPGGQG